MTVFILMIYNYSATMGIAAQGRFSVAGQLGGIDEGFFVVQTASAIEVPNTHSHFFEFDGYIALFRRRVADRSWPTVR